MAKDESGLSRLKKEYGVLQKKYKLPGFSELNDDFDIEKLQDKETEHLLRLVRFVMVEKLANIVRFLEVMLNPTEGPTPLFMMAVFKSVTPSSRNEMEALYKELSKIELASLSLDIHHEEKEEAKFILEVSKVWAKEKLKLKAITQKLGMTWTGASLDRGYLG